MSTVYLLDPSASLTTHILTKASSKMSIGNTNFNAVSSPYTLNVQGVTCSNNVSAFQIPADTSNNRPSGQAGYIRYNTNTDIIEYWNGATSTWTPISSQPPAIASVSPTYVTDLSNTITITGSNFVATPNVFFIDKLNSYPSSYTAATSVTFISSSSLITTFPTSLINAGASAGPYSVQVTNTTSGLSSILSNAISVNLTPYWSPSNSLGAPTTLGPVDGSTNLTKANNIRTIAIDPEGTQVVYALTNDTSQNLVSANVTFDPSGYLLSTSTTKLASAASYSFKVDATDASGIHSTIGYFNFQLNAYSPLLSFSSLSGLTVSIGYVDNNGANYRTTVPYNTSPPGYTIYTIQCTSSSGTGVTGTGTVTYPAAGICPTYLTYFIIGGGGGGGGNQAGSGGGAGGLLYNPCYVISASGTANIQVGQGGAGAPEPAINAGGSNGGVGSNSFLSSNIAYGGAGGVTMNTSTNPYVVVNGVSGGNGSGSSCWQSYGVQATGGSGTSGQGNAGGNSNNLSGTSGHSSGGGGGYAGPGTDDYPTPQVITGTGTYTFSTMSSGWGGNGIATNINGQSQLQVAGGGGGGCYYATAGNGGVGGGGAGLSNTSTNGSAGTPATDKNGAANTGGGGGGGGLSSGQIAGNGGCGIMILRHVSYITTPVLNTWTLTSVSNITTTTIYLNNAGSPINSGAGPAVNGGYTVLVLTCTSNLTTGTCTFTPTTNIGPNLSYLICGGGGCGGVGAGGGESGGGGGGVLLGTAYPVSNGTGYSIQVGAGGNQTSSGDQFGPFGPGANSSFNSIIAYGGAGGGGFTSRSYSPLTGGCGAGGGEYPAIRGSAGTIGQGYNGGSSNYVGNAAGGGGAGGPGVNTTSATAIGPGGPGLPSTITGTLAYYGGGGGASGNGGPGSSGGLCGNTSPYNTYGHGGAGNGGSGTPTTGCPNFGGGGGGQWNSNSIVGLYGGSGTVILRFPSYTMS